MDVRVKLGEHYTVKVGDWEYDTVIDEYGVQRFVGNEAIRLMIDGSTDDFERSLASKGPQPSFTLNDLAIAFYNGNVPLKDMADFYTGMQYSVSGFCDLSYFEDLEIINPLWKVKS